MTNKKRPESLPYDDWLKEQRDAWLWTEYPTPELPQRVSLDDPGALEEWKIGRSEELNSDNLPPTLKRACQEAIELLPSHIHAVLVENCSLREVSEYYKIPKSTLHRQVESHRKRLKELLSQ